MLSGKSSWHGCVGEMTFEEIAEMIGTVVEHSLPSLSGRVKYHSIQVRATMSENDPMNRRPQEQSSRDPIEQRLMAVMPAGSGGIDRDRLMFAAGEAASRRADRVRTANARAWQFATLAASVLFLVAAAAMLNERHQRNNLELVLQQQIDRAATHAHDQPPAQSDESRRTRDFATELAIDSQSVPSDDDGELTSLLQLRQRQVGDG